MFSEPVNKLLEEKLAPSAIRTREAWDGGNKTLSYLEGWYVQDQLNKVFGFGNWSQEIITLERVGQPYTVQKKNYKTGEMKENYVVIWQARVRLSVWTDKGAVSREDVGIGIGEGQNMSAIEEKTIKEAVTDGMKRAAKSFGDRFGLALYDKEQKGVMSPQEERLTGQRSVANAMMITGDREGLMAWLNNNKAKLLKGAEAYPELSNEIADLLGSVAEFIAKKD